MNNQQINRYAPRNKADLTKQVQKAAAGQKTTFMAGGATVELSVNTVRNYLVSGNKDRVTDQEIVMFINLCKFAGLNPWLREAYCIKYGNEPATLVVGKSAFEKRAEAHPAYDGFEAGIITYNGATGMAEYHVGSFRTADEEIIGGWAEVYRKDRSHSTRVEVSFDEYVGKKADGSINGQWSKKPATMIRKVALVQALREAFPEAFSGMYDASEMGVDDSILDAEPVDPQSDPQPQAQPRQEIAAPPTQAPQPEQDEEALTLDSI